jgi:Flp pilus assembly pilin Flp
MKNYKSTWRNGIRTVFGESGATFIEYAMLAGLVAIVVAIAVAVFGKKIKGIFANTAEQANKIESGVNSANINGAFGDVNQ